MIDLLNELQRILEPYRFQILLVGWIAVAWMYLLTIVNIVIGLARRSS